MLSEYCGQLLGTVHRASSMAESSVWAKVCSVSGLQAAGGVAVGLAEGGGAVHTAIRSSTLSAVRPIAIERISPTSTLLPHVS